MENKNLKKIVNLKCFKHLDLDIEQLKQILTNKKDNCVQDSAFDVGSRDCYYHRPKKANIILDRVLNPETQKYENIYKTNLTKEEKDEYLFGYYYQKYIEQTCKCDA